MTILDFLKMLRDEWSCCPADDMGRGMASNAQLKRWLKQGAIRVNGKFPGPWDEVEFPIEDLVFFPGGKRKTTVR